VEAWEALVLVRDVEATIGSTLHGAENAVSSRRANKTDIEVGLERALVVIDVLGVVHREVRAVDLLVAVVHIGKTLISEESTCAEETCAVGSGVVSKTGIEAESSQLKRVGSSKDLVAFERSVDHLGDDTAVSAADAEAVLASVILVFLLEDKALAGVVVSLSLSAPAEFGLVPA